MDTIFEYKEDLIKYINSISDDEVVVISLEQILYLILSNNPREDDHLLDITKKIITASTKTNSASCSIANLKRIVNYTSISGLNSYLNSMIYDLLTIDQIIIKNNYILKEDYNENLHNLNIGLTENYNIKKQELINAILTQ